MIRCHHAGKMGDLIYALPALRALHRLHGQKIHLTTSGLCYQLGPLLEEQPYIAEVVVDASRPYEITKRGTIPWAFYAPGEGLNLSLQPRMFEPTSPIPWTLVYAELAGVKLEPADYVAFPSLVNHRRWFRAFGPLTIAGVPVAKRRVALLSCDAGTVASPEAGIWVKVASALRAADYDVLWVGGRPGYDLPLTVPTMARLIAEADCFIGAHSAPWQLARHTEVPAVCLAPTRGLERSKPIDTPYHWYEPDQWREAVDWLCNEAAKTDR